MAGREAVTGRCPKCYGRGIVPIPSRLWPMYSLLRQNRGLTSSYLCAALDKPSPTVRYGLRKLVGMGLVRTAMAKTEGNTRLYFRA